MTEKAFLTSLLKTSAHYSLRDEDKNFIKTSGVEPFIYARLMSKKFRKFKADLACEARTKTAISLRVQNKQPLQIIYPQGGYKLWRIPSSPTVDWAEFFNISYLLTYIAPIAAAYPPGVHLMYYMHTMLPELHDNLTTEEIQLYVSSFEMLLQEFRKYLPPNITISVFRDLDLYTREEYLVAIDEAKKVIEAQYPDWDQIKKDDLSRMAQLNIKWAGREDWTTLSASAKAEKIYLAALYESAASLLQRVSKVVKAQDNILVFTKGSPMFIGIGSAKASIAKYWVGFGVLERREDSFQPIILTPNQYEKAMQQHYTKITTHLIPLANFSEIFIFDKPFSFT